MGGSRKFRQGVEVFISHQRILQSAVLTSLEKQLDLRGPITSRGRSVPIFLRKPIATCDFAGGGGGPDPLSPLDHPKEFHSGIVQDKTDCTS